MAIRPSPAMASRALTQVAATAALALAVDLALMVFQLVVVDGWLHGLATRMPLRGFFLLNYTKSFGRYRAPGFQPGKNGIS